MNSKVLFVDRDGTLIEEPEDHQVDALHKLRLVKDVIPSLLTLMQHGYRLVMVSNQDGLGTESFPQANFDRCQDQMMQLLNSQGIVFDEVFVCPHLPADQCGCRKPRTGLLSRYLATTDIAAERSAVIGDRETDMEFAEAIGVRGLRVNSDHPDSSDWPGIADALCHADRTASVVRETSETRIVVSVNLDSGRQLQIDTGIGFFDHMLEQIARHGGIGLTLKCDGDLEIDEHHTVEDTAICLGGAIRNALGNKVGIGRYGFLLPMDESEAKVSLDLSGRFAYGFAARFPRDRVGEFSTEMVEHFFRSFAEALGAALHIEVHGENTHHMIEACFKGVGRVIRQAVRKEGDELPSTKGSL